MRPGVGETGVDVRVRQQAAADRRPLVGAAGDPAQLLVVGGEQVDQRAVASLPRAAAISATLRPT
jgi:hypothetical protein